MWKDLWQRWTIDRPTVFGDWLWDVFVVQLADFLNRLTLRKIIALIPVVILVIAYFHRIPLPPELLLVGDLLAYIDIFSVLFLLGILSQSATVLFIVKQTAARVARVITSLLERTRGVDVRHRREDSARRRKRLTSAPQDDDDEHVLGHGVAWA
jgi:hypothetical protein